MILKNRVCAMMFVVLGAIPAFALAQSADIVLLNGKVLTVDANFSTREAVAVRGERILAVGSSARIRRLADSRTEAIDLKGKPSCRA